MKFSFLVIGSNSFSGAHFVNYLLELNHYVIGASRSKEPNSVYLPYKNSKFIKNFKFVKFDINKDVYFVKKLILKKKNYTYNQFFSSKYGWPKLGKPNRLV